MFRILRSHPFALVILAVVTLVAIPIASAETIELDFGCKLNDAVRAANTNQPVGECRAGDPGHDHIFVVDTVEILESPVVIREDVSIVGDRFTSTLDGRGRHSFLHIGPGIEVHLQDFFLSNGFGTRATGQIRLESGSRLNLTTTHVINCRGVKEIVAADSAFVNFGYDARLCGKMEPFDPHPPIIPLPTDGPHEENPIGSKPKDRVKEQGSSHLPTTTIAYTCEQLPADIIVRPVAGTRSGIQCQTIDGGGIGRQDIIDMGVLAAVDIWAYVEAGVEVCLPGDGELLFLDAAFAPRRASWMASYREGDMTCAAFNRAGSLVLLPAGY